MLTPRRELRHTADPLDTRLYKGGDGGASQMRNDELDRQKKVQMAVDQINRTFGIPTQNGQVAPTREQFTIAPTAPMAHPDNGVEMSGGSPGSFDEAGFNKAMADWQASQVDTTAARTARDKTYTDLQSAVTETAMRDVDRQFGQASKANKFGLARSGLLGGSVDIESGGDLAERYGEGRIKATQAGQSASADLRGVDEKTRQNLISLAQSGLDTGTASSLAAGQMAAAADAAKSNTNAAVVGRLFDDIGQAYVLNRQNTARYGNQPQSNGGFLSSLFGSNRYTGTVRS